jgi:hypothetical protein
MVEAGVDRVQANRRRLVRPRIEIEEHILKEH